MVSNEILGKFNKMFFWNIYWDNQCYSTARLNCCHHLQVCVCVRVCGMGLCYRHRQTRTVTWLRGQREFVKCSRGHTVAALKSQVLLRRGLKDEPVPNSQPQLLTPWGVRRCGGEVCVCERHSCRRESRSIETESSTVLLLLGQTQ